MDIKREDIVRASAWAGAGIAAAFVLVVALLLTLDLSFALRHRTEAALTRLAGRQVIVSGEVRLIALPSPAVRLGGLFIGNAPGGTRPDFVLAKRVDAHLSVGGFPHPHIIVSSLDFDGVSVTLEPTKGGMSWTLAGAAKRADRAAVAIRNMPLQVAFEPRSLTATNVTVALRLPWQSEAMIYPIDRLAAQTGGPLGAYVALVGHLRGDVWHADADLSSLEALITGARFKTKGRLSGLGGQMTFAGFGALNSAEPSDLSAIGMVDDTSLLWGGKSGATPTPAKFTFSLKNSKEAETVLAHFQKLGSGDLDLALEFAGPEREHLTGQITAKTLDLAALPRLTGPLRGAKLFSTRSIPTGALKRAQIDLKLGAESVNWHDARIGRLELGLWANNGILAAGPIKLDGPQVDAGGDATLDVRDVPKLSISFKAKLANLAALISGIDTAPGSRADLALELVGTGNSLANIMATSYGQTDMLIGPGGADGALASALPIEIAYGLQKDHSLAPLPNADRPLNLACIVSRFDIAEGHATSRVLFVDTSAATTTGAGMIDLTNEGLDFRLAPRPKDPDLIGQARDIDLRGTLADPVFAPEDSATKGLSRMASETALAPAFDVIMPLLDADSLFANPCVRSLMGESALAGIRPRAAAKGGRRAEAP